MPLAASSPDRVRDQPLAGEVVVFTGKLSSLGRKEACELVIRLGGAAGDDVNAKTTMLVLGAEGIASGAPNEARTNKLKRAEELNAVQQQIRIIREPEFCTIAGVQN